MTPVSGLANKSVFGPTILAITTGLDNLINNLAEIIRALEHSTGRLQYHPLDIDEAYD
jgi:hypothetical protein